MKWFVSIKKGVRLFCQCFVWLFDHCHIMHIGLVNVPKAATRISTGTDSSSACFKCHNTGKTACAVHLQWLMAINESLASLIRSVCNVCCSGLQWGCVCRNTVSERRKLRFQGRRFCRLSVSTRHPWKPLSTSYAPFYVSLKRLLG